MTVDEILASGTYTDRRGRTWEVCGVMNCSTRGLWWNFHDMALNGARHWTVGAMRLLIERDQHRDECPGITDCHDHPVPVVYALHGCPQGGFAAMPRDNYIGKWFKTQVEALNAARVFAVTL